MFPTISIVTPSFNQKYYLEETIKSVLSQKYDYLEYIIIDGASTDGSIDIIKKYSNYLKYWISEKDNGQYDAINKGFKRSTGDIMAWINSDDIYLPSTFSLVGEIFKSFPEVNWISSMYPLQIDNMGRIINCRYNYGYSYKSFLLGEFLPNCGWGSIGYIQQDCTFWRRSVWENCGSYINTSYNYAGDFELWSRFFNKYKLVGINTPLSAFRIHSKQKTYLNTSSYNSEAISIFKNSGGNPAGILKSTLRKIFRHISDPLRRNNFFDRHELVKNFSRNIGFIDNCEILTYCTDSNKWHLLKT